MKRCGPPPSICLGGKPRLFPTMPRRTLRKILVRVAFKLYSLCRRPIILLLDHIEGLEVDEQTLPQRRDPDALPPSNFVERISDFIYQAGAAIFNGNLLYAVKAGLLTGASCSFVDPVLWWILK